MISTKTSQGVVKNKVKPQLVFFVFNRERLVQFFGEGGGVPPAPRYPSRDLLPADELRLLLNRPDLIDDALLRPGRLDTHIPVTVPDEEARREIFAVGATEVFMAIRLRRARRDDG